MFVDVNSYVGLRFKKGVLKVSEKALDYETKDAALTPFREGVLLLYQDNLAALEKFDQASKIDHTFYPSYFNAGVALEMMNRFQEAARRYEKCLVINKEQEACLSNLLLMKAKLGQADDAKQLSERYLADYPDRSFANAAAAKLAFYQKDLDRALKLAEIAIEQEAENVEALYVIGRVFYDRKKYHAAKFAVKNALEIAPSHGDLYLLLGHIELALNLVNDAVMSYEAAVKYKPSEEALTSYGLLLLKRGRAEDAAVVFKRLLDTLPPQAQDYLHLGNAFFASRKFTEAKEAYFNVLKLRPDDTDALFNLGLLFFTLETTEMTLLDRLKTSQNYFTKYREKEGLSTDRVKEVDGYLESLKQKIEVAEQEVQVEKDAPLDNENKP